MEISPLDNTNCVKPAKKRDVLGLLRDMGYSTTPSADTFRPMTRVQTIAHFYNEICNDTADAMNIGSGEKTKTKTKTETKTKQNKTKTNKQTNRQTNKQNKTKHTAPWRW